MTIFAATYDCTDPADTRRLAAHAYKATDDPDAAAAASDLMDRLGWAALEREAQHQTWDIVTAVTSTQRPGRTQLDALAARWAVRLGIPYARLLVTTRQVAGRQLADDTTYQPTTRLTGTRVLLVEDTWVTGSHLLAAADALTTAGAAVTTLAVFRRTNPEHP